jgi:hypothetical protein
MVKAIKRSPVIQDLHQKDISFSAGASSSGKPTQGASSSSKPMEGGNLKLIASKVGRLHLEETKLSGSTGRKTKSETRRHQGRAVTPKP